MRSHGSTAGRWLGAVLMIALPLAVIAEEPEPDLDIGAQLAERIAAWAAAEQQPTLGQLGKVAMAAIGEGSLRYNQGDVAGCAELYRSVATALVALRPDEAELAPASARAWAGLAAAVARDAEITDPDQAAWALRYGFERIQLEFQVTQFRGQFSANQGYQQMARGNFDQAVSVLREAVAAAEQIRSEQIVELGGYLQGSPITLAHALLITGEFAEAGRALERGLQWNPEWPRRAMRLVDQYPESAHATLQERTAELEEAVLDRLDDMELQFLLGYVRYFSGDSAGARDAFRLIVQLDDEHVGARSFLDHLGDGATGRGGAVP